MDQTDDPGAVDADGGRSRRKLPALEVQSPWRATPPAPAGAARSGPPRAIEPHYQEAFDAWRTTRTPAAASDLLKAVHPVLAEAARSYAGGEAATPTTLAHAKRLALEAFERYDPERAKLKTHLLSHLRGLRRITNRATAPVYVPEQTSIDARRLSSVVPELTETLGRHPSDAEVADHTGLGLERIRKARAVPGVLAGSQAGDNVGSVRVDKKAYDNWIRAIYLDGDPVDQVILERSLGLHGHKVIPAHEIADLVNLSPAGVSLRKRRLQKQLDEYETFLGRTGGGG